MKKFILAIFSITLIFTACGTLQLADVGRLSPGMTQIEVDRVLGKPVRILSSSYTQDGEINVYEYITYRDESYAVEFINGRLNRYDFMYENVPPTIIDPNPAPVYPIYPVRPTPPQKPTPPVRPQPEKPQPGRPTRPETDRPNSNTRPETSRPSGTTSTGRPATKPSESSRPSGTTSTTRPATKPSETSRPSGTTSTTRPVTRSTTTKTSSTKSGSEEKKTDEKKTDEKSK